MLLKIITLWIIWISSCVSLDIFERSIYHGQVQYDVAQDTNNILLSVQLTRDPETTTTALGHEECIKCLQYNTSNSSLLVWNSCALLPGRYEFTLVLLPSLASVILDVLSSRDAACDEQMFGKCSQHCQQGEEFRYGYQCYCEEDYILQSDQITCLVLDPLPQLLIATPDSVMIGDVLGGHLPPVVITTHTTHTIRAFDYDYHLKVLYYATSNVSHSSLSQVSLEPSGATSSQPILHFNDSMRITDIAADWINEDIYYINSRSSSISVWSLNSNTTKEIIASLVDPRNLLYSSATRRVIWMNETSVMWISLDESSSMTKIDGINFLDIAVDSVSGEIFAISNRSVVSIDNNVVIVDFDQQIPIALDVFEVFAYVVLNESGTVMQVNTQRNSTITSCGPDEDEDPLVTNISSVDRATDIQVLHPSKQSRRPRTADCSLCEGACTLINGNVECLCDNKYQLSSNGYSCYPSDGLEVIFSTHSSGNNASTVILVNPRRGELQKVVDPFYNSGTCTGVIYAMDYDPLEDMLYYGDRLSNSGIWRVSADRLTDLQDGRTLLVNNTTVWSMSYDWINGYLYWTDDSVNLLRRQKMSPTSAIVEELCTGTELRGVAVDPINELLYWVDNSTIFRSSLNCTGRVMLVNDSEPLGLALDLLSGKLYWTDRGTIWEGSLDALSSSKRNIFSDENFIPFKIELVRNYVFATSLSNKTYAIINLDDLSAVFIKTSMLYYGVSVASSLRKPSLGTYSCVQESNKCSHLCEEDESSLSGFTCGCPEGYILLDNTTCANAQVCPLCPNGRLCYSVGRNISCDCTLAEETCTILQNSCGNVCENGICDGDGVCMCEEGFTGIRCDIELCGEEICSNGSVCTTINGLFTCQCPLGYVGVLCDEPVCEPSCLPGGMCIAPNECNCSETYNGTDCSERVCTPSYCNGGTCLLNFGELGCRCPTGLTGPQCQVSIGLPLIEVAAGVPTSLFVLVVIVVVIVIGVVYGYLVLQNRRKKSVTQPNHHNSPPEESFTENSIYNSESIYYAFDTNTRENQPTENHPSDNHPTDNQFTEI